ncbi:transketolase [Alphaproteobacteria bacterium]|nr:transketolase [Alphaproteobacteria bacterium]
MLMLVLWVFVLTFKDGIMFRSLANAVRFLSIHEVGNANSGHLGMALGMADCLTVLFRNFLVFNPKDPRWPNRDRLIFSGGHGAPALYALLHLTGYEKMTMDELKNFRKLGSLASGHPEYNLDCGIEVSTGLLGQGFANAVGIAIEERLLNARLGNKCINHFTYVCAGDGDLMEGITHEASAIAGHLSLGHLIVLWDDNGITIDGKVGVSTSEDTLKRYESYGWHVSSVDGHNEIEIAQAIAAARLDPRPSIIACQTQIGFGTSRAGTPKAHSGALSHQEIEDARKTLRWAYGPFEIPEYIEKTWQVIGLRHRETYEEWMKTQSKKYGYQLFAFTENLRKVFRKLKKEYFVSRPFAATRISAAEILSQVISETELLVSGSCDLGSSSGCLTNGMKAIEKADFSGNYIHYGVREHAMGAIMNGITSGGKIKAIGGTFLAFSDYMRADIRMAALMKIPSIFVFSHDSIGVGEDGPTHQPVEQIASLRAIPNLNVFRPADALETLECLEYALKSQRTSVILLTRQGVLSARFSGRENLCESGGYLLYEDNMEAIKRVTIIATGSEVGIALDVKKMLNDISIATNVVSIPCWSLFDKQSSEYKQHVLGSDLRIGIEASNGFGWEKYLGSDGIFFGVNDFGKSAPASDVYKYFGLTSQKIFNDIVRRID